MRYTVVVTSPAGARNVNYEGIRCDNYEWRLYASINDDQNAWDRTVANDFRRIENGELNAYHAALYQDYFCANKLPTGDGQADRQRHPVQAAGDIAAIPVKLRSPLSQKAR